MTEQRRIEALTRLIHAAIEQRGVDFVARAIVSHTGPANHFPVDPDDLERCLRATQWVDNDIGTPSQD